MNEAQQIRITLSGAFFEVNQKTRPGRMYPAHLFDEAMKGRPPALEPWKNHKHVRIRQQANDMVASGKLKPTACQTKGCKVGPDKTVKHHIAYDRPDNVGWHCTPHHKDIHHGTDRPMESCSAKCNTCDQESCRCIADRNTNQSQQIMGMLEAQKKIDPKLKAAMLKKIAARKTGISQDQLFAQFPDEDEDDLNDTLIDLFLGSGSEVRPVRTSASRKKSGVKFITKENDNAE